MKKYLILHVLLISLSVSGQTGWKQSLHYELHVKFNPSDKSLDALMKLNYINHSPDTLRFIWFHVWPNAFRNDRTLYSDQLLENGDTRFYFSAKDQKGYLNRLDFRVNGILASTADHPEYIDVIKLLLPKPLLPGDSISINSSFHLRLPYNLNGYGYNNGHFELRNWYPEPAVYDAAGWHPLPMLIQGGAYHEVADFKVEIETPVDYTIAAGTDARVVSKNAKTAMYDLSLKNANGFAWIADNHFLKKTDSLIASNGQQIMLQYFYTSAKSNIYKAAFELVKKEIISQSVLLGDFPYTALSLVETDPIQDQNFSGILCIGKNISKKNLQTNIKRALLQQWFQTALLTNERQEPWLSKGLIEYYLRNQTNFGDPTYSTTNNDLWLRVAENEKTTQPIISHAPEFSTANDSLMPGHKAARWLIMLEETLGVKRFNDNMLKYISVWRFGHPDSADFRKGMQYNFQQNLQPVFSKLNSNDAIIESSEKRTLKPAFIFSAKNSARYNYIGFAPVPGYNRYDGFMLGALIHNINLPENKFEFLLSPMYAFGSQHVTGLGRISYSWHPENHFSRISIGLNLAHFDSNKATDSAGRILYENFSKLVPYIRFDFKPSNARSTVKKWLDFKSYLMNEQHFGNFSSSSKDSLIHANSVYDNFRYVNQLSFNLQDNRALYPYDLRLEFQQSELFYRINLQANYFMNYPDGGGLRLRFFAAKFGVWNQNNIGQVTRYEPKLLGVNGEEDYLYEDYFIGRSASYAYQDISVPNGGLPAQQIMNRDGGLKLRIDETDYIQGRSSSWVTSLGFNSSLPAHMFPFPVPIRLFFDVGTYAEAWQTNATTSRFLFVGGIQLSLLKNVLNIYAPIFYSADFKDAMNGYDFGRKITFSIDIQNINYKKIIRKMAGA